MAVESFDEWLKRELVYEGGNVDRPKDPGGRTRKGVTQTTYNFYRQARGLPTRDVYTMDDAELKEIYRRQYWNVIRGDELPRGVDFVVGDAAINSGPVQAGKWLQRALGADYKGQVDGLIGPGTVAAARAATDHDLLVAGVCQRRLATLKTLNTWSYFGKGWNARISNALKTGQAWATGSVGPNPVDVSIIQGNAKALVPDVTSRSISTTVTHTATALGTAGAAVTSTVQDLQPVQQTLGSYAPWIAGAFGALAAVGIIASVVAERLKTIAEKAKEGIAEVAEIDPGADAALPEVVLEPQPAV